MMAGRHSHLEAASLDFGIFLDLRFAVLYYLLVRIVDIFYVVESKIAPLLEEFGPIQ